MIEVVATVGYLLWNIYRFTKILDNYLNVIAIETKTSIKLKFKQLHVSYFVPVCVVSLKSISLICVSGRFCEFEFFDDFFCCSFVVLSHYILFQIQ